MTEPATNDLQSIAGYIADELLEPATSEKTGRQNQGGRDASCRAADPSRFGGG